MIVFELVQPELYQDRILSLGNEALGIGYLDGLFDNEISLLCYGAFSKGELIGFVLFYLIDINCIIHIDRKLLFEPSKQIIHFKSAIVKAEFRRERVASTLISSMVKHGYQVGVTHFYAEAWSTKDGLTSGNLLEKHGFQKIKEVEKFWFNDSLEKGYQCKECGKAPCHCSAVIFVKGKLSLE